MSTVTQVRVVPRYDSPVSNLVSVRIPEEDDPPEYTQAAGRITEGTC